MPKLDWIGKKAVVNHHREVPFHLLRSNDELSVGDPGSGNLLVQGDNLVALKALLPYYAGQVTQHRSGRNCHCQGDPAKDFANGKREKRYDLP